MKQVKQNPYRLLGIYANATTKERLANQSRLQAFLKVGKAVSFPLDLTSYLGEVKRSEAIIATASANLTLPQDQIRYAQFWFVRDTPIDTIAFNHLESGDLAKAVEIWEQRETPSSLQNLIICSLIREEYAEALSYAERLYGDSEAVSHFVALIVGDEAGIESDHIGFDFLDALCEELGGSKLLPLVSGFAWQEHLKERIVPPLISAIKEAIEEAQKERTADESRGASAGYTLYKKSKSPLAKLKKLLSTSNTQYQLIADELGLEILQCAIDYYNDADGIEAARETARLARYASSIVVGKLAKDRCQENLQIIERIIESLPPDEVAEEVMAILDYLQEFNSQPSKINVAVTLLGSTRPHFQAIKKKLGATNTFYLKLSTKVVNSALQDIIEEVNSEQEKLKTLAEQFPLTLHSAFGSDILADLENIMTRAWRATLLMDSFDMEEEFKHERYSPNRSTLKDICEQLHVSTSSSTPARVTTPTPQRATSTTSQRVTNPTPQTSFTESESKRASKEREDRQERAFLEALKFGMYGFIPSLGVGSWVSDSDNAFNPAFFFFLLVSVVIGAFVGWNKKD